MGDNWFSQAMQDEVPYEDILARRDNGEFLSWNFVPFDFRETGYEDVLDEIKKYRAVDYLAETDEKKREAMVDAVLAIYRSKNILPIQYYNDIGIAEEIEKCIAYDAKFDGNTVNCGAGVGTSLCNFLFPNLFNTPSLHDLNKTNARSLYEKFYNDEYLKRAIKFCFSYKEGCPVPTSVMGGLRLVGSAPTNFRPMNAKAVYERFCPPGGTIYDFCCVSGNTEYFNGEKWVRVDKYKVGDKVAQFRVCKDGMEVAELVDPLDYICYLSDDKFYNYKDKCVVTGNHNMPYYDKNGLNHCIRSVHMSKLEDLMADKKYLPVPGSCIFSRGEDEPDSNPELVSGIVFYIRTGVFADGDDRLGVSEYCVYGDNSEIILTDKVYTLCLKDRRLLLKALGFDINSEYCNVNSKALGIHIANLINMSYAKVYARWYDKEGGVLISDWDTVFFNESSDYFSGVDFNDDTLDYDPRMKYCFTVPSHMLLLRYNGRVFITGNCGFGGRMLGALSSKKNFKYVGTDPCTETMSHLHELGEYIEGVTGREDSYELHCCGSEEFIGKKNSIDFAFSSPPYFNLEVYSDEPTQCYNRYPKLEDWLEGYVRQTIKNIYRMLKPGRVYAVNIADFTAGREVAYVDEWIRLSSLEGMPLFDTVYLGVNARAGSKEQSAGESKKENILIFKKPL